MQKNLKMIAMSFQDELSKHLRMILNQLQSPASGLAGPRISPAITAALTDALSEAGLARLCLPEPMLHDELLDALLSSEVAADPICRCFAAFVMGRLGSKSDKVADTLLLSLRDPSPMVRQLAITALGLVEPRTEILQLSFIQCLSDDVDEQVRAEAAEQLTGRGTSTNPVVAALLNSLSDSSARVRWAAIGSLVQPVAKETIAAVKALRSDPDAQVRSRVAEFLDPSEEIIHLEPVVRGTQEE